MKRVTIILLTVLYLLPSIGFSMDVHWCCKNIKSVEIAAVHPPDKGGCGNKMPGGCCKNSHISVKLEDNQKSSSPVLLSAAGIFGKQLFTFSFSKLLLLCVQTEAVDGYYYHFRLSEDKLPAYLANCVFRV